MANARQLMAARSAWSGGAKLPYKRRLAYLQSNGKSWIDTGYHANQDTDVEADVEGFEGGDVGSRVFGSINASFNVTLPIRYGVMNLNFRFGDVIKYLTSYGYGRHSVRINKVGFYVDGVKKIDVGYEGSFLCTSTSWMFMFNPGASSSKFKLYSLVVRENGVDVMRFIPVIDNDGVPCMYDEVGERFYYNKGTDAFLYGDL